MIPVDTRRPACQGCRHLLITHDARFPYGCRLLQFKSRRMPCLDVLEADGSPCAGREAKLVDPKDSRRLG